MSMVHEAGGRLGNSVYTDSLGMVSSCFAAVYYASTLDGG
jgi:hypothetical protein